MAYLKEGVLLKLVEEMKKNSGNDGCETDTKAATSALLQIRSIIPVLEEGDLWPDRGFFLKVSDSSHALYVSLSKHQNEMVLSNRLKLGQFIYVSRLEDADPLPLLRGVVTMPGRRPCDGSPVDIFPPPPIVGRNILRGGGAAASDSSCRRSEGWRSARARSSSPSKARPKRRSWSESEILGVTEIFDTSVVKNEIKIPSRSASANVSPVRSRYDSSDDNSSTITSSSSITTRSSRVGDNSSTITSSSSITTRSSRVGVAGKRVVKRSEVPAAVTKPTILICDRKGAETRISWTSLPSNLVNHGKEVIRQRDVAVKAAVEALQEACASERLLNCLSTMSQLPLAEGGDLQPFVDKFFNLQHDLAQTKIILHWLTKSDDRESESKPEAMSIARERTKNGNAWVKSAVALDLSPYLASPPIKTPKQTSPLRSFSKPKASCTTRKNDDVKKSCSPPLIDGLEKEEDDEADPGKRRSVGAAAELASTLEEEGKKVFLRCMDKYLEQVERKSKSLALYDDHEVAGMMYKVKMVSDWLNSSVNKDEDEGAYARARDKIYAILLKHVERTTAMAFDRRKISI